MDIGGKKITIVSKRRLKMSEELFTDADAASTLETMCPNLAEIVKRLVKKGESVEDITRVATIAAKHRPLIPNLVEGAALHYQSQLQPA